MNINYIWNLLLCSSMLVSLPKGFAQLTDSIASSEEDRTAVILSLDSYAPKKKKEKKGKKEKSLENSTSIALDIDSTELINANAKHNKKTDKGIAITAPLEIPLRSNCREAYHQIDEFTGKRSRALSPRWFFSYTPKKYANFFGNSDYLHCEGNLAENDGNYVLQFTIKVQGRDVQRQFGTINPQSELILRSLKGNAIALPTLQGAKVTNAKELTIYEVSYSISKSNLRSLKNFEIDSLRIIWSNGFQDYEVYYLDFIRDQLACFDLL